METAHRPAARSRIARGRAARWLSVALVVAASTVAVNTPAEASSPLRVHAAAHDKHVGAAIDPSLLSISQYQNLAATEFSSVTPENAMKWDATEPSQGNFTFSGADAVVSFAQQNNQHIHGHTLVWHNQTPGWVQNLNAGQLRDAMESHISTVVGRYAGTVESWDVVNEVIDDNANLRDSFWLQTLGQSYIADAFTFARAADPGATLCINDYNIDGLGAKSDAYFDLVQSLLSQGVPIDCIGFQGHLGIQFGFPNQVQQNLQRFADLGLEVRITELDVRMILPRDANKDSQQATYYTNMIEACLAVEACSGITTWGIDDGHSWVPDTFSGQGAALLWDENYQQKPAYTAVHDILDDGGGGGDDTTPPGTPGAPSPSSVGQTTATLTWAPASDQGGSGLAGYDVYAQHSGADQLLGSSPSSSINLTGLSPDTSYTVYVVARDGAGNTSDPSPAGGFTTEGGPGGGGGDCEVDYSASDWGGHPGFTASVSLTNTGSSSIEGWTLRFDYPAGQTIDEPGWSAIWSQSGATVTVLNEAWNGTLAPGQSASFGANGLATAIGNNPPPTAFTLNGTSCD